MQSDDWSAIEPYIPPAPPADLPKHITCKLCGGKFPLHQQDCPRHPESESA